MATPADWGSELETTFKIGQVKGQKS